MNNQAVEKLPFLDDEQQDEENGILLDSTKRTRRCREQSTKRRERYCVLLLTITLSCFSAALGSLGTHWWWHEHIHSACLERTSRGCRPKIVSD